eukprot:884144-Pelagomonas_calceolata.AAC.1
MEGVLIGWEPARGAQSSISSVEAKDWQRGLFVSSHGHVVSHSVQAVILVPEGKYCIAVGQRIVEASCGLELDEQSRFQPTLNRLHETFDVLDSKTPCKHEPY